MISIPGAYLATNRILGRGKGQPYARSSVQLLEPKRRARAGWTLLRAKYDDGGFSCGLQRLLEDVRSGKIDLIVVYKVDRLTRSLADFAKLVELLDEHNVSFVSVTQQFNTTTSMGRLTLNVMLSFAQFERENTSERIRDKISGFKRKGLWVGGMVRSATTPTNEGSPSTSLRRTGWLPQLSQAWQPQPTDGRRANRASSPRFAR